MKKYILLSASVILMACTNSPSSTQKEEEVETVCVMPLCDTPATIVDTMPQIEETNAVLPLPIEPQMTNQTKISKAYQEGYDQGYEDGESDSCAHEGYQASFDDSNNYRGEKREDYELGYEEGYEDGYEDGRISDEDYEDD